MIPNAHAIVATIPVSKVMKCGRRPCVALRLPSSLPRSSWSAEEEDDDDSTSSGMFLANKLDRSSIVVGLAIIEINDNVEIQYDEL